MVGAFSRAIDAVAAALEAQLRFGEEPWPEGAALAVRMALHTGDAQLRDAFNYFGPVVIRCARLRALAHGGQVLATGAVHDVLGNALPADTSWSDLGEHRLKDLNRPERVFQLGNWCHPRTRARSSRWSHRSPSAEPRPRKRARPSESFASKHKASSCALCLPSVAIPHPGARAGTQQRHSPLADTPDGPVDGASAGGVGDGWPPIAGDARALAARECGVRAAPLGVLGAVSAGEVLLLCLGQKPSGKLKRPVLFLVQVVAHLHRELPSDLAKLIRCGVDSSKLLDELLSLVMVGERVATDAESSVDHEERDVQMALLGGRVRVEFLGEPKKGGAPALARRTSVCHCPRKRALHLVAGSEIVEDRHVDSLVS